MKILLTVMLAAILISGCSFRGWDPPNLAPESSLAPY